MVFDLLREQLWYRPFAGVYIKLVVMLGKCKQPEKAHELFQLMIDEGCDVLLSDMDSQGIKPNTVTYNTLIDAYGKAEMYAEMESLLAKMLMQHHCQPDAWTMNSTMRAFGSSGQIELMEKCYEKFQAAGIQPTIRTFNLPLDSYGKSENLGKMSAVMEYMHHYNL
ncbi:Pentatricopeptide repeat-containing protein [Drosera capensis]